ncbi:MAG TPA: GspH/FimT family pseudopilin [Usitatibacter sp.]|nr:GspH/FimT family pseudopilin [Usitatibacter sp.]
MRRAQSAFTLLEVIVVLVIAASAYALMAGTLFRSASSGDLKAAARSLASGLRQAQTTAMITKRDALMTVDLEAREYRVEGDAQVRRVSEKIDLKLFTAQAEVSGAGKGAIRFYPDGSSTGGRITVSSGERQYLVDVDWITGRVSIGE